MNDNPGVVALPEVPDVLRAMQSKMQNKIGIAIVNAFGRCRTLAAEPSQGIFEDRFTVDFIWRF